MNEEELAKLFNDAEDPTDIVLAHYDDAQIVQYGVANYDIDVEYIRETLGVNGDEINSADLMLFEAAMVNEEVKSLGDASDNLEDY